MLYNTLYSKICAMIVRKVVNHKNIVTLFSFCPFIQKLFSLMLSNISNISVCQRTYNFNKLEKPNGKYTVKLMFDSQSYYEIGTGTWKIPIWSYIFIWCIQTNIHLFKYSIVQQLHYNCSLKSAPYPHISIKVMANIFMVMSNKTHMLAHRSLLHHLFYCNVTKSSPKTWWSINYLYWHNCYLKCKIKLKS